MDNGKKKDGLRPLTMPGVFLRSLLIQGLWNFEGMQNMGFLLAIDPALRDTKEGEELNQARRRHSGFFNTHPYLANAILGASIHYESRNLPEEAMRVKERFIGALGAMGDNLFWNGLRPAVIGIAILFAGAAPWIFLALYNLLHLPARFALLWSGWMKGDGVVNDMAAFKPTKIIKGVRYVSLVALGAVLPLVCWEGGLVQGLAVLIFAGLGFFLSKYRLPNHLIWLACLAVMVGVSFGIGDLFEI